MNEDEELNHNELLLYALKQDNEKLNEKEWLDKYKSIMEKNIELLEDNNFAEKYPTIRKKLGKRRNDLIKIMRYFSTLLNYKCKVKYYKLPIFWASYETILKECKLKTFQKKQSRKKLSESLSLFNKLGIIFKIDDKFLKKSFILTANEISSRYKLPKHCNFYIVPELTCEYMKQVVNQSNELINKHHTNSASNIEWTMRTYGNEIAKELYPQHDKKINRGTTYRSDYITNKIVLKILEAINTRGYILQSEITGEKYFKRQWINSQNQILQENNLQKRHLNKELKERFGITQSGWGYIIYNND